jgi:hypothetical protein
VRPWRVRRGHTVRAGARDAPYGLHSETVGVPVLSHACDGRRRLYRGTYTGQAGPVYIESKDNAGAYDREIFLVLKEFEPSWSRGGDMPMDMLAGEPLKVLQDMGKAADAGSNAAAKGFEAGYELFSINGKMSGYGEPIRVKRGERVLFHVLNASATEIRSLALPGHTFRIVALDGNPVPTPATVPVLWPASRSWRSTSSPTIPVRPSSIAISKCTGTSASWHSSNTHERRGAFLASVGGYAGVNAAQPREPIR